MKKLLAIVLCVAMVLSVCMISVSAKNADDVEIGSLTLDEYVAQANIANDSQPNSKQQLATFVNALSNVMLNKVLLYALQLMIVPNADVESTLTFDLDEYANFYSGNGDFIDSNPSGVWSLGYAEYSILPDDFGTSMKYARGSYVPWWYSTETYEDDDLRVRTVVLDDNSGRGKVAFCSIDCIGIANTDVRKIRDAVADFAKANNIVSINVTATHTHSGIDSQGVWNRPLTTVGNNILSTLTFGIIDVINGVHEDFLAKVIDSTAKSIKDAVADMTQGDLYYATLGTEDYFYDRTPPYVLDANIYRLRFDPYDDAKKPTIIATFGCHPESSSYDFLTTDDGLQIDTKVSGDFVYYMEKLMNKAGYNFIYIQGNVGTNTSSRGLSGDGVDGNAHDGAIRYGYELAYVTLGMTLTEEECAALNESTGDLLGVKQYAGTIEDYTIWYEDWEPVTEEKVDPVLNIRLEQVMIPIENNLARILLKAGLASNFMVFDFKTFTYCTVTEFGYMELGSSLKVFLSPGEIFSELLMGGECLDGFGYKSLREMYGENVIVCDLMNDAVGYVEPDNYYTIAGYQYDPENDSLESDTWCLMISMGEKTASEFMKAFMRLVDNAR